MSKAAQEIDAAHKAYQASLGTPSEASAYVDLLLTVARVKAKRDHHPASRWCGACQATVYLDNDGRCIPCGGCDGDA